jgi:hypothetical protein
VEKTDLNNSTMGVAAAVNGGEDRQRDFCVECATLREIESFPPSHADVRRVTQRGSKLPVHARVLPRRFRVRG